MPRTSVYLDEGVHRRLRAAAERQGRTVSDLVRQAVERAYGPGDVDRRLTTLEGIASLWRDRDDLGAAAEYVRRYRGSRRGRQRE